MDRATKCLFFLLMMTVAEAQFVTVSTDLGDITGLQIDNITRFLGIPYAEPPIGKNRFKPPVPVTRYDDLAAVEYGGRCVQTNYYGENAGIPIGKEDCLFLNVFTPQLPNGNTPLKAVMFWIHGGAFTEGSAVEYEPTDLAVEGDVVVVTINYRLGAFGFLTFGNDLVSGNMGLRDQILALQWVNDHIHKFGGDPERITIFGESAGGVSVHALQVSPLASGLFARAIAQSGTLLLSKCVSKVSKDWRTARSIAQDFNCSLEYDEDMLACLQNVDSVDLQKNTVTASVDLNGNDRADFWPSSDYYSNKPVMPLEPLDAMMSGNFNRVPLMTGSNRYEGVLSMEYVVVYEDKVEDFWKVQGPRFLGLVQSCNMSETTEDERLLSDAVLHFYTGANFSVPEKYDEWQDMFLDSQFLNPDQKTAELTSKFVDVYNYFYTFSSNLTVSSVYGAPDNSRTPTHGDDLLFLFDPKQLDVQAEKTEKDIEMSRIFKKYWTNFAKFGKPSMDEDDLPIWKPYSDQKNYLELNLEPEMKKSLYQIRNYFFDAIFWNNREKAVKEERITAIQESGLVE